MSVVYFTKKKKIICSQSIASWVPQELNGHHFYAGDG